MEFSVNIEADELANKLINECEWAMDVLGALAERSSAAKQIASGDCGSRFHNAVPSFLRELANQLDANNC